MDGAQARIMAWTCSATDNVFATVTPSISWLSHARLRQEVAAALLGETSSGVDKDDLRTFAAV